MNILRNPQPEQWADIVRRPRLDTASLAQTVHTILNNVRARGDEAVLEYEEKFDHVRPACLTATKDEIEGASALLPAELRQAIELAHDNITRFHSAQRHDAHVETCPGVDCWQKSIGIERVGLYIPGGTAPLFSTVLMLAAPARVAGCKEIILATPPDRNGNINPAILFAARTCGVTTIYKAGGVQAIGALAYGTATIPAVDKIFGPGNQYVMAAKQAVSAEGTAIDMPAGPSEVCVIADKTARPDFVAADLLSQAEHGRDSQVLLITDSEELLTAVTAELEAQLAQLPRRDIAAAAMDNSTLVVMPTLQEAIQLSNLYAPEHLIINVAEEHQQQLADEVVNAGSVFIGQYACESAGDYASGTNHTLPTHGHARAYSGVNLDSFCRKVTFQRLTTEGIRSIGPAVELMAEAEQLFAHKNAMTLRVNSTKQ